ncbi:MAG: lipase family alpha/beta hydrolase [Acidimicrobiales bacterium]
MARPSSPYPPLAARLRSDGYSVWIFELPGLGLGDIHDTAAALNTFADEVRAGTGATKVDLVGHSQGGLVARGYVKWFGGASEVDSIVSLGAPHYGTAIANIAEFFGFGDCLEIIACQQMGIGSTFLGELNAGDDTIGAVRYTNLYTLQDELVIPIANATMRDGARNVKLQSQCWWRVVGHVGLILDGAVYSGVDDALAGRIIDFDCWAW